MDRRGSSSPDYYKRRDRDYGRSRRSRSRSRSRSRNRSKDRGRSRRSRTRSRSRERSSRKSPDLYRDLINQDYQDERDRGYKSYDRSRDRNRERRKDKESRRNLSPSSYLEEISNDSNDSLSFYNSDAGENNYAQQVPNNKLIVRGLAQHITEADISNDLMLYGFNPVSIRLIRRRKTGASRGFAFVEFNTEEEATRCMEYKQGILMLQDQYRAVIQYSIPKHSYSTDWYCGKCLVFNFRRRKNCFTCFASRGESVKGGEGSDEVSNILTKKIMLRNLDVLTNEEGVLTTMQEVIPTLVLKITKILICRDPLTSTSRGICYLAFDNLVDSMNTHNALKALDPPLQIDNRDVLISYCVDGETKNAAKGIIAGKSSNTGTVEPTTSSSLGGNPYEYTLADVPRLAEYSANMYASNSIEHDHYLKYYTQYYVSQISKGQFSNLPTISQMGGDTANSGAAVAQSAMQRKMKKFSSQTTQPVAQVARIPTGTDGQIYPTPDVSLYQYDETSGYYYDPVTGLYYDANSQYYYNNETNSHLYWDNEKSTYILATAHINSASQVNSHTDGNNSEINIDKDDKKDQKKDQKQDKVKVAKKIVKDMEKWAKQLNQKKDMMQVTQQIVKTEEQKIQQKSDNGYADVGFAILEKKEKSKFGMELLGNTTSTVTKITNKLVPSYGSDSENDQDEQRQQNTTTSEKDYVDFDKLTCLLCKRAFQSHEILSKHLKMSNLHKENLQKYNLSKGFMGPASTSTQSYRDRAKERRLKYGEDDSPPINKSKERFQRELEKQQAAIGGAPSISQTPIGENNVGNRLLQKMGWSEGQGLGRSNQGRTNIIEAESRAGNAGLGSKTTAFGPGDDYKSYIKKMMKSRYDSVDIK